MLVTMNMGRAAMVSTRSREAAGVSASQVQAMLRTCQASAALALAGRRWCQSPDKGPERIRAVGARHT